HMPHRSAGSRRVRGCVRTLSSVMIPEVDPQGGAQPSRLRQARDWYMEGVNAVPDDDWGKSTLCEDWTARHLVAHVATGDQLFLGMLMDAFGKDRTGLDLPTD